MSNSKRVDRNGALTWPLGYFHVNRGGQEWGTIDCELRLQQGSDVMTLACRVKDIDFQEQLRGGSYSLSIFEDGTFDTRLETVVINRYRNATSDGLHFRTGQITKKMYPVHPDIVKCLHMIVYVSILIDRCPRSPQEEANSHDWFYEIRRDDIEIIEGQIGKPLYELIRLTNRCLLQKE